MATNEYVSTLVGIREDLRIRIKEILPENCPDTLLTRWINQACLDVAMRLNRISDQWFGVGTTTTCAGMSTDSILEFTLPTDCMKLIKVMDVGIATTIPTNHLIPLINSQEAEAVWQNSNFDYTVWGYRWGKTTLRIFIGSSVTLGTTATTGTIRLEYFRRPTEITTDTSSLDVPEEFTDLVTLHAQIKAMRVLGKADAGGVGQEIESRYDEVAKTYGEALNIEDRDSAKMS